MVWKFDYAMVNSSVQVSTKAKFEYNKMNFVYPTVTSMILLIRWLPLVFIIKLKTLPSLYDQPIINLTVVSTISIFLKCWI